MIFRPTLATLFSVVLSAPLFAQQSDTTPEVEEQRYYDVELVIFKNLNVPKGLETRKPYPAPAEPVLQVDFSHADGLEVARSMEFEPLPLERMQLIEESRKLIRSSRYELLLHLGWTQPGLSKDRMVPVRIRGGDIIHQDLFAEPWMYDPQAPLPDDYEFPQRTPEDASSAELAALAAPETTDADSPSTPLNEGVYELSGTVSIELSRYLHVHPDLMLRKKVREQLVQTLEDEHGENDANNHSGLNRTVVYQFPLTESRRMRSKRLHYLDHPEYGMLVLITQAEAPSADTDAELAEAEVSE